MKENETQSQRLDPNTARKIIDIVGGQGNPPEYG